MKTISESALRSWATAISAFVVGAGGYLCFVNRERPWPYLLAIAVVCVAWIARYVAAGDSKTERSLAKRRKLTLAIILSGLLLAVALGTKLIAQFGWMLGFASELGERSSGFLMGAIVVVFANTIPKQVGSGRRLAMLRAAAWALVLGGAGYALAWALLPLTYAGSAALLAMLLGLAYAAVRVTWCSVTHRSVPPPPSG